MDAQSLTAAIERLIDAKLRAQVAARYPNSTREIEAADEELEYAKAQVTDTVLEAFGERP